MSDNNNKTAFVQLVDGQWKYNYFNSDTCKFVWEYLLINERSGGVLEGINTQLIDFGYINIISLPELKLFQEAVSNSMVMLITKGNKNLINKLYPNTENYVWEVDETINSKGEVVFELSEPEINKALRFVFSNKPKIILIALSNSISNSIHEQILNNVLNHAGYKVVISKIK